MVSKELNASDKQVAISKAAKPNPMAESVNRFATIVRNVSYLAISMGIGKFSGMIIYVILARYIGPSSVGQYAFAVSFTMLFTAISDLGLNVVIVRTVASDHSKLNHYLGNIILLRTILSLIAFVVILIVVALSGLSADLSLLIWIIAGATVFSTVGLGYRWAFQSEEKLQYESLLSSAEGILLIGGWLVVLSTGYGLIEIAYVRLGVSLAICGVGLVIVLRRIGKPSLDLSRPFWIALLATAAPFMIMAVCNRISTNLDTVLLGYLKGDTETGRYNLGYRLAVLLQTMAMIFQLAIYPAIIKAVNTSAEEFHRVAQRGLRYTIILAFWIGVITTLYAKPVLTLIYGDHYENVATVLRILIWTNCFMLIATAGTGILFAFHKDRLLLKIILLNLGINLSMNLLLIYPLGAEGAAIAILLSEGITFGLIMFQVWRHCKALPIFGLLIRPLFVAGLAALPFFYLNSLPPLITLGILSVAYLSGLLLLGAIPEEDRRLAVSVLKG